MKSIISFGNWEIKEDGIHWTGIPYDEFIPCTRLDDEFSNDEIFDWLIHIPGKSWMTKEDMYTLNMAYVFALEYFGVGFNTGLSLAKTFKEQKSILDSKTK